MSSPSEKKAIVGEQFVAPHPTAFTVTKLYTPDGPRFSVTDYAGSAAVMRVEDPSRGFRDLRSIPCLDIASRQPVIALRETGLGRWRWDAFSADDTSESNRLFVAVMKSWFFLKGTKIDVTIDGDSSGVPHYVVRGNYYSGVITVSRGSASGSASASGSDNDVAVIKKVTGSEQVAGENTYDVSVNPGVDQAFVLALTVILDQMYNYDSDLRCCSHRCQKRKP